jgi:[ribosomal protein S18]-alanine N-acetyltransferase
MSPTPPQYALRMANHADRPVLNRFLASPAYTHRHLDWREPLEWLDREPFWILERNQEIEAVLANIPDPADVAWVRLFAVASRTSPSWTWSILFERTLGWFSEQNHRPTIVSLGMQDWFSDLLVLNHFNHYQDIIVLSFEGKPPDPLPPDPDLLLRPMLKEDLPAVTIIDNLAFEAIWRLSLEDLTLAYDKSSYKTVLESNGEIVGYQMSAFSGFNAHLARLAVHPVIQHRRIGFRILQDVLSHFMIRHGSWNVTLNTQDSNQASLNLYQKAGFRFTGDRFPVFVYPVSPVSPE